MSNGSSKTSISITRNENFNDWFHEVVKEAELADHSSVKGCMVIRPWGFAIWERIQSILDRAIKDTGHENAYFPLFVPLHFFDREAEHVSGFAKECAVVTHRRLEQNENGEFIPAAPLAEPLIVRPTSETIIGEMFSRWVHSYRDLPLLINQWANVVRWEMRTRPFLRTSEFLWQEGHTAHATEEEALIETRTMLDVYERFIRDTLAIHPIKGRKTESEKFPGAKETYCIEALMQDNKALQMGTSHFFGETFARSFNIQFSNEKGNLAYAQTTSWGVSTRLIGGCILSHGDDNGLILPPTIAPKQIIILPVHRYKDDTTVIEFCKRLERELKSIHFQGESLRVLFDQKDMSGGEKKWNWIRKGVPLILEIGPKEVSSNSLRWIERTDLQKNKISISTEKFLHEAPFLLESIQKEILHRSKKRTIEGIHEVHSKEEFERFFENKNAGLALCYCSDELSTDLKERFHVTPRCLPLEETTCGTCIFSGQSISSRVLIGRAY
ncbi:proline--tRNA ligase [Candidatus Similichlamydia epinepheli]|uniref:proline--tRNA ligase n=1 Tax=Candidatus Similichlamydia epinepheli TaxID=1903953 RepID=UPI000D3693E4|nr:proline--tRNA ligase [Candidatus Similichlamydia epinepheli]